MINKLEWRRVSEDDGDHTTYVASVSGGLLVRHVEIFESRGSVSLCFVPAISEKEGNRADFKAWLESERRRESERFNTVTNDQPAIDVADPDAM